MKRSFFAVGQMKPALMLLMLVLCIGCGGGSTASSTPTSAWAGTYTGDLNFSGCPSDNPCGGDSISATVAQAYSNPEFSPTLTITGTDSTTGQAFTGTGTALDISPAPNGPGTMGTNATITTSLGDSLSLIGSGSSQSSSPVLIQTCAVHSYTVVNGVNVQGPYLGTLTRQ